MWPINSNVLSYTFGGLLIVSEVLGITTRVPANGIVHALSLFFKHLDEHPTIDENAVVDSLQEALIDEIDEIKAREAERK